MPPLKAILEKPTSLSMVHDPMEIFNLKPSLKTSNVKQISRDDKNSLARFAKRTEDIKLSLHDLERRLKDKKAADQHRGVHSSPTQLKKYSKNLVTRFYEYEVEKYIDQQRRLGLTKPIKTFSTVSTDDAWARTISTTMS